MATKKRGTKKKAAKKTAARKTATKKAAVKLSPKANGAVRKAADILGSVSNPTAHILLKELHDVILLRCLKDANGNYAEAAKKFGPSRQSVQQYANSSLRDGRWRAFQQKR